MQTTIEIDVNGRILVSAYFHRVFGWTKGVKTTLKSSNKGVLLITEKNKLKQTLTKFRQNIKNLRTEKIFLEFRKQAQN